MAIICVAENQRPTYEFLVARGAAIGLGDTSGVDLDGVRLLSKRWSDPARLQQQSELAASLVDGLGAQRIVDRWEWMVDEHRASSSLAARPAVQLDAALLFGWRNDPVTRKNSLTNDPVPWEEHVRWLTRVLGDPTRLLLVLHLHNVPVGTVRWDRRPGGAWEVSITVAPDQRGRGLAQHILHRGEIALADYVGGAAIALASVHHENEASKRLFARSGYRETGGANAAGFALLQKKVASPTL